MTSFIAISFSYNKTRKTSYTTEIIYFIINIFSTNISIFFIIAITLLHTFVIVTIFES